MHLYSIRERAGVDRSCFATGFETLKKDRRAEVNFCIDVDGNHGGVSRGRYRVPKRKEWDQREQEREHCETASGQAAMVSRSTANARGQIQRVGRRRRSTRVRAAQKIMKVIFHRQANPSGVCAPGE